MSLSKRLSNALPAALAGAGLLLAPALSGAADPHARAARNYDTYCVQCHGLERNGQGVNSASMSVQPRDHTDAKGMADIPDQELFDAIKEGGLAVNKSVLMPVWGNVLSEEEIKEMVAYLRHVCEC